MKPSVVLLLLTPVLLAQRTSPVAVEQHKFVMANFSTESGVTLPHARVVYGTYGHLNATRDNVILLASHYMANLHGYEWLIGPGRALDTSQLFLVTSFTLSPTL